MEEVKIANPGLGEPTDPSIGMAPIEAAPQTTVPETYTSPATHLTQFAIRAATLGDKGHYSDMPETGNWG